MPEIAVIGSLNADLVLKVKSLPQRGATISAQEYHVVPGGKGANQAVAAARLGSSVRMIGAVGSDSYGDMLIGSLTSSGVDCPNVRKDRENPTGTAFITVAADGANTIVTNSGSNGKVTPADIAANEETIKNSDAVILQLEIPLETVEAALSTAKKHGVLTVLNPGPARELPSAILEKADYFVPNETESELYTGVKVDSLDAAKNAALKILEMGIPNAVITLGANGVYYRSKTEDIFVPAFKTDAVDTTGAGDCFIGAFVTALLRGDGTKEALRYACAAAAISTRTIGAQPSFPKDEAVSSLISS